MSPNLGDRGTVAGEEELMVESIETGITADTLLADMRDGQQQFDEKNCAMEDALMAVMDDPAYAALSADTKAIVERTHALPDGCNHSQL